MWAYDFVHARTDDGRAIRLLTLVDEYTRECLAIDSAAGKVYWTQLSGSIRRANMNGTSNELIVGSAIGPHGLALDLVHRKLYWTNLTANRIQRSNLNGSNVETLVTVGNGPAALALDLVGGKMYWTDLADGRICVANLDGKNVQLLVAGLNLPLGIALDFPPVGLPALSTWGLILSTLLIASAAWYRLRRDSRSYP